MLIFLLLILFFICLAIFFYLIFTVYAVIIGDIRGAPFVPSSRGRIHTMIRLAQIVPGETVVDLGSGSGSIVIEAARTHAHTIGIEMNPFLVLYSRWMIRRKGFSDRAKIIRADFRSFSLIHVDIVFVYLLPKTMERIREKFLRELKPGARIISNAFPIPGWTPIKVEDKVFLYRIK